MLDNEDKQVNIWTSGSWDTNSLMQRVFFPSLLFFWHIMFDLGCLAINNYIFIIILILLHYMRLLACCCCCLAAIENTNLATLSLTRCSTFCHQTMFYSFCTITLIYNVVFTFLLLQRLICIMIMCCYNRYDMFSLQFRWRK